MRNYKVTLEFNYMYQYYQLKARSRETMNEEINYSKKYELGALGHQLEALDTEKDITFERINELVISKAIEDLKENLNYETTPDKIEITQLPTDTKLTDEQKARPQLIAFTAPIDPNLKCEATFEFINTEAYENFKKEEMQTICSDRGMKIFIKPR